MDIKEVTLLQKLPLTKWFSFQSFTTIFHYINVRMHNIPNLVSIIGMDFMHYATKERGSKSIHATAPMEHVGYWVANELKVSCDNNTCKLRAGLHYGGEVHRS